MADETKSDTENDSIHVLSADDDESVHASTARSTGKRSMARCSNEMIGRYAREFKWVKTTQPAMEEFGRTGKVECTLCVSLISVGTNSGNLGKHEKGDACVRPQRVSIVCACALLHCAHCSLRRSPCRRHARNARAVAGTSSIATFAVKEADQVARRALRAVFHARHVSLGINPNQIRELYDADKGLDEARSLLRELLVPIGAYTTVTADLKLAHTKLQAKIAERVAGTYGALVADGASLKESKAFAIVYETSALEDPVLLALVFPEDSPEACGPYDSARAVNDIKDACSAFKIDIATQVTCFMGDNVTFNNRVADELGVQRAWCLPHALALVVKHGCAAIPNLNTLTHAAGALIHAGGACKRTVELKAMGLVPTRMQSYPNRFASIVGTAVYNLANFTKVKAFFTTGKSMPRTDEDDDEIGVEVTGHSADAVRKAYKNPMAPVVLAVCCVIFENVPDLIKTAGGTFDAVSMDLIAHLASLRYVLEMMRGDVGATMVINQACSKVDSDMPKESRNTFVTNLLAHVKKAAEASLASYDKHIKDQIANIERRFAFDPRRAPTLPKDGVFPKEFFGACATNYGPYMVAQYQAYADAWADDEAKKPGCHKDLKACEFWSDKRGAWPQLAEVALWWTEFPTSSVSCERGFSVLRNMCSAVRGSMNHETIAQELSLRMNASLLAEIQSEAMKDAKPGRK